MAMHLDGVPTYSIMLIGRWASDAFMGYIRRQVMEFAQNISTRMIIHQDFFSIPDFDPGTSVTSRASPHTLTHSNGRRVAFRSS